MTVPKSFMANYEHKQTSPLHLILDAIGIILLIAAWISRANHVEAMILVSSVALMILAALCFGYLIVRDQGDSLALHYGPLPVFRRHIPFARITAAEPSRSAVIDGWGIHYIPGRGTTYNLWGFDCVKMKVDNRTVRVGSDDVQGLARFLEERLVGQGNARKSG
jgi:hypothetical protein